MPKNKKSSLKLNEIKVVVEEHQKPWLETHLEEFAAHISTKGRTEGSRMEFVRTDVLPEYFRKYHPNITDDMKKRMSESARKVSGNGFA